MLDPVCVAGIAYRWIYRSQYYQGEQMKEDYMGKECMLLGDFKNVYKILAGKQKYRDHRQDLDIIRMVVMVMMIAIWILTK